LQKKQGVIMDYNVRQLLEENGCSPQFIEDAMRYEKLYKGDIDSFIDHVEDILMSEEEEDDLIDDEEDDILNDEEDDPIYKSDYNYDGNDDNIYFEDEDGEEAYEEDEEDE